MMQDRNIQRVLIIDDEAIVRDAMEKALKKEGYELYFAENGRHGLELFHRIAPNLIYLDLRMPVMDGFEFLEKIRIRPEDPYLVIVITGHGDDKEVDRSFNLGVNFFLRKPLGLVEVCCLTRRCLELKAIEVEVRRHRNNLEQLVAERTRQIKEQLCFAQTLIDSIPTPVYYKNTAGEYLGCNLAFAELNQLPQDEIIGKTVFDLLPAAAAEEHNRIDMGLLARGGIQTYEGAGTSADGGTRQLMICKTVYKDQSGVVAGLIGASFDITELNKTQRNLDQRTHELEEVNSALRVLLKEVSSTQENTINKITHNLQQSVLPHLKKIRENGITRQERIAHLDMAEKNLDSITSSFPQHLSSPSLNLSPRELEVADYIRMGKSSKEAAALMRISKNAVEFHRSNLRRKLGVKCKKTNLRTYLLRMA